MLHAIKSASLGCLIGCLVSCGGGGGGGSSSDAASSAPAVADISFSAPVLLATIDYEGEAGAITAIKPMEGWLYVETRASVDAPRIIWSNRDNTEFFPLPFPGELDTSVVYKNRLHYHSNFPVAIQDVLDETNTVTVYESDGTVTGTSPVWALDTEFKSLDYFYPSGFIVPDYASLYEQLTWLEFTAAKNFVLYSMGMDDRVGESGLLLADENEIDPSVFWPQSSAELHSRISFTTQNGAGYFFENQGGIDYGTWIGELQLYPTNNYPDSSVYIFRNDASPVKPMAVIGNKTLFLAYEVSSRLLPEDRNFSRGWGIWSEDLVTSALEPLYLFGLSAFHPEDAISPAMDRLFDDSNFSVSGSALYFAINIDEGGQERSEVYRSDGTAAGTTLLTELDYPVNELLAAEGQVYCVVRIEEKESVVFVSGVTGEMALLDGFPVFKKATTVTARGSLLFSHYTQQYGSELWYINGPGRASGLVYDISEGPEGSDPSALAKQGNDLYFTTGTSGELWQLQLD